MSLKKHKEVLEQGDKCLINLISQSLLENIDLGRLHSPHCIRSMMSQTWSIFSRSDGLNGL